MLRIILCACVLIAGPAVAGRPMIIHQYQVVDPPASAGYDFYGYSVAIDGDWAIVTAGIQTPIYAFPETEDALLYHRVNGQWLLDRTLVRQVSQEGEWNGIPVAMNNGLAALGFHPTRIFRRNGTAWTEIAHPFTAMPGNPDWVGSDLKWDGNALLAVTAPCTSYLYRPWGALISTLNADGTWTPLERLTANDPQCNQEPLTWGFSGNTAVAGAWTNDFEVAPNRVHVFHRIGSAWPETSAIDGGEGEADVRGNEIFVSKPGPEGTLVYRNDDTKTVVDGIRTLGASYGNSNSGYHAFAHNGDLFLQEGAVFRKNALGKYEHVATLQPKGVYSMVGTPAITGRNLITAGYQNNTSAHPVALFFKLPTTFTPSPVHATGFEAGAAPFTSQLGSFAIATGSNGNHVYRQSSLAGDYRAILADSDWAEQSIEADIKPTAFESTGTSDRWVGLAVRYVDANNYYYVTLRNSGTIQLKRRRNGVFTMEIQRPLQVVAGRNYHVALQAVNHQFRVFVDGKEIIYWEEADPIPHGSAALIGYKTAVDYDNVVAAQVGQSRIYDLFYGYCTSQFTYGRFFTTSGSGNWSCTTENYTSAHVIQQASTAGDARAVVGTPTDDMIVKARAKATAFAATAPGSQERWFGLTARYTNPTNYYYLSVRNTNTVSLRKLVNGAVTVLATAPLTVTPGTFYDLRLDTVGNELRAFVNNKQVLQATDSSHPSGQGGMLMYKTAAEYRDYLAWQP